MNFKFQTSNSNFKIQTHFEGNSPEPGEERTVFLSDSATAIPHENVGHDLGGGEQDLCERKVSHMSRRQPLTGTMTRYE